MTTNLNFDIAIVGGGIIGKATALAMTKFGYRIALLAHSIELRPSGPSALNKRIYAMSASSQALLECLCVWQSLDHTRVMPVYNMRVYGDRDSEIHLSAYQASVRQLAWIVESSLIESTLDIELSFQPNITLFNEHAEALDIQNEFAVLSLSSNRTIQTDLVIGADGANSWVRKQIGLKANYRDYGQKGIVANFKAALPHYETAYQWFADGETIALLPLPDGHVSLIWSASTQHADKLLKLDSEKFSAEVERVSFGKVGSLNCISSPHAFPLILQKVDRLIAPHVVLVGDAAHVIHPLAGQGMNLGLRDVAVLKNIIANKEIFRNLGDIVLLRRYERARRADISTLSIVTDSLQRLFSLPGTLTSVIRNSGMVFVNKQPIIKRWLILSAMLGSNLLDFKSCTG
ncbi:MAG: UbiH/UbiF family hydroxylase [Burkholderia sp.]|nr:UbiH/UbiF family hydroxylase [Burkholderia sp.]